ncbi:MAG: glutathione S-transferase [Gammaproteobacteria bacterium]|nr:MAG: glutathione S-transferase [Gammaproteobacteria bacterium]
MADLSLVIGNKNYSSWSLRPWVFMRQTGIDFHERRLALFTDEAAHELAKYDSDGKVPILLDGDLEVWDTLAILEYLSEQYLSGRGWPQDRSARATARSISAEMHSSFPAVRGEMPMNCRKSFDITLSEKAAHEVERVKTLWRQCRKRFGGDGEWLFGNYSIADAMFAPVALRFHGYGVPLSGVEADYVQSVLSQSCIQEWIEAGKQESEVIAADEVSH